MKTERGLKVCIVGATGLVGQTMLQVLDEHAFPISQLFPVGSARSVGTSVLYGGQSHEVISIEDAIIAKPHVALFSAGGEVSEQWVPQFADAGITVIDNSSTWRMD